MKIQYHEFAFRGDTLERIQQANDIIAEYQAQGFDLTLRQLYYQFVARGIITNNEREYKKLGDVIANGRLAGLIDWKAISDRTRYLRRQAHWASPQDVVEVCASQFRLDKWAKQPYYCEVWIEKDALIGVIEGVCQDFDVPYLACRGYASASEVWRAGHERFRQKVKVEKKQGMVFYLGDHDPSGIDMTRDVKERLDLFVGKKGGVAVQRLALNMDQVETHNPPPNPTKMSDSRATDYVDKFGEECWELDALDPTLIRNLIDDAISGIRDEALWDEDKKAEALAKRQLAALAAYWDAIVPNLPTESDNGDQDNG